MSRLTDSLNRTARVLESKSYPDTTWIIWASDHIAAADYCRSRYGDDTFRIHNWSGWCANNT